MVITGGGGGLGSAIALELCQLGARVMVCGRTESTLRATVLAVERNVGTGRAIAEVCDVRDPRSVDTMLDACAEGLGMLR